MESHLFIADKIELNERGCSLTSLRWHVEHHAFSLHRFNTVDALLSFGLFQVKDQKLTNLRIHSFRDNMQKDTLILPEI